MVNRITAQMHQGSPQAPEQALPASEPCLSPTTSWDTKDCTCLSGDTAEGLREHPWNGKCFLPLLPSTVFCLAGTTKEEEQTLPRSTALTNITLMSRDSWGHTSFLGKFHCLNLLLEEHINEDCSVACKTILHVAIRYRVKLVTN